jgi:hypothetical protein
VIALKITPKMRYAELRQQFRSMLPTSRSKKLSATQAHHLAKAASLQQIIEVSILERALGAEHDRFVIERLKVEVQSHLTLAGAMI